jgi:hypothetical protein
MLDMDSMAAGYRMRASLRFDLPFDRRWSILFFRRSHLEDKIPFDDD